MVLGKYKIDKDKHMQEERSVLGVPRANYCWKKGGGRCATIHLVCHVDCVPLTKLGAPDVPAVAAAAASLLGDRTTTLCIDCSSVNN